MALFRGTVAALFFTTCVCYCLARVRYDQSQSGDYNIHIDLKNIEVLAILDDGSFVGEYDYDYDQLTEKPQPPHIDANSTYISPNSHLKPQPAAANCSNTTTAPKRNATVECKNTTESSVDTDHEVRPTPLVSNYTTTTISNSSAAANLTNEVTSPNATSGGDRNSTESGVEHTADDDETAAATVLASTSKPIRRCGSGFYRDVLGRCRRIRRPYIPLLGLGYPPRTAKTIYPPLETGALPRK